MVRGKLATSKLVEVRARVDRSVDGGGVEAGNRFVDLDGFDRLVIRNLALLGLLLRLRSVLNWFRGRK